MGRQGFDTWLPVVVTGIQPPAPLRGGTISVRLPTINIVNLQ